MTQCERELDLNETTPEEVNALTERAAWAAMEYVTDVFLARGDVQSMADEFESYSEVNRVAEST